MITIYKYDNRKLYSKDAKKYLSLKDIIQLVKDKQEFEIVEYVSKKDITTETLRQAVAISTVTMNTLLQVLGDEKSN